MHRVTQINDDPDDAVIAKIEICVRRNGSMSTGGTINDEAYALAVLYNAIDAIKSHHTRIRARMLVPGKDVELPELRPDFEMPKGTVELGERYWG